MYDNKNVLNFIPPRIAELEEYIPVESNASIKLDANENPYPMSQELRMKLSAIAENLDFGRYPDPYARELVEKFAEVYNVNSERVIAGCGSDEIIHLLCQTVFGPNDSNVTTLPDFSMYAFYAYLAGGRLVSPKRDLSGKIDFDALRQAASDETCKCVMFSNPCNPTGAVVTWSEVIDFVKSVNCLVVVDEAYGEFCTEDFSVLDMAGEIPNLIVLKTLSKAFGLASLRVGFAVADEKIIGEIKKVKSPYNLNSYSQAAAVEVLNYSSDYFALSKKIATDTKAIYKTLYSYSDKGRYKINEPYANFMLIKFEDEEMPGRIHKALLDKSISIKYSGGDNLRISCGTEEENQIFLQEFIKILEAES